MTAVKRDLVVEKGATFRLNLRLKSKDTGLPLDLTGYIGRMQIRESLTAEDVALDLDGADFTFDADGGCHVRASAARTMAIDIPFGVYDLEIEAPGGDVERLFEGKVKVKPNVTRPPGVSP